DHLDVLVQVNAELLGPGEDLFAVDAAGEGLVLELLLDGLDVDVRDSLAGRYQGDRRHEADELVDGVKHLLHRRRPGGIGVVGVGENAIPDLLRPASLFEVLSALDRMPPALRMASDAVA